MCPSNGLFAIQNWLARVTLVRMLRLYRCTAPIYYPRVIRAIKLPMAKYYTTHITQMPIAKEIEKNVDTGSGLVDDILQAVTQMKLCGNTIILPNVPDRPVVTNGMQQYANFDACSRVKNMSLSPDTLAHLLFVMSELWDQRKMVDVIRFVTRDWSIDRMADLWAIFFNRYVANAISQSQINAWGTERFGELVGRSIADKNYVFVTDLVVKFVIGHDKGSRTLFDVISTTTQPTAAADLLEKIGQVIGKVVAMQPNWAFPNMGVALKEFTTVIPKFVKGKYDWFTQDMYLEFISNVLVSSGVYRQKELSRRVVSKNFMHNALKDVTDFWKAEQVEQLLEKVYRRMADRDSYIKYWAGWLKGYIMHL
jgi:hypothetical protein